jgi:hypothetical protein
MVGSGCGMIARGDKIEVGEERALLYALSI